MYNCGIVLFKHYKRKMEIFLNRNLKPQKPGPKKKISKVSPELHFEKSAPEVTGDASFLIDCVNKIEYN